MGLPEVRWQKKGLLFRPEDRAKWMGPHTQMGFVDPMGKGRSRVYFSTRNSSNQSLPAWFDVDFDEPSRLLGVSEAPILELGAPGEFDDSGVMPSWLVEHGGVKHLYYIGWNVPRTTPFRNAIGLALSHDGGQTFKKVSNGPILDRGVHDPLFLATPCVLVDRGKWKMWYMSGTKWVFGAEGTKPRCYYQIQYAESDDGIQWRSRGGEPCITYESDRECAFARPCVRFENGLYRMWYCYRWDLYRIGYAESLDGIRWERKDQESGIAPSATGWDSEQVAYPYVFFHGGKRMMLYNGNGFGQTGIGYAVEEDGRQP